MANFERNQLLEYRKKLQELSDKERILHDLHLRGLANGEIQGPLTGLPSLDKIWLKFYNEDQIRSTLPNVTIYDFLKMNNANNMDGIAIDDPFKKYSYRELFENIDSTAASLHKLGVRKNSIILGMLPQFAHEDFLLYGVDKAGGAISFIIPGTPIEEIIATIKNFDSKLFFAFDKMLSKEDEDKIYKETNIEHIVVLSINPLYKSKNSKTMSWKQFINLGKNYNMPDVKRSSEDLLFVAKTGGTTGVPKNVMLNDRSFNAIVHQYLNSALMEKYLPGDKWIRIWPLFSATAAVSSNHLPLCASLQLVLRIVKRAEDLDKVLLKSKPNHLTLAPPFLDALKKSKKLKNKSLSFVKSAGCGGMKMSEEFEKESMEFFKEHDINSFLGCGYGCTENGSVATIRMSDETAVINGTGVPMVKTNITVFDPDTGNELGYGEQGEICFHSDAFMLGYYKDEAQTKEVIRTHNTGEKWLHTGDLGTVEDITAQVNVDGRMSRVIFLYTADRVYLSKVEEVISSVEGVESNVVVAGPDSEHEGYNVPVAVIVVNENYNEEEVKENVLKKCQEFFPPYSVPRWVVVKKELPLITIGKIDIVGLEKELKEGQGIKLERKKVN